MTLHLFLICSVRNASDSTKQAQERYVAHMESLGWVVHYPPRDTNQSAGGLEICRQNLHAIEQSDEVHVFYDSHSQGVHFDMGIAFALRKRVKVANNELYGPGKSYARMLDEWEEISSD